MARKKGSSTTVAKPAGKYLQLLEEIWRDEGVLQRHLQDHNIDEADAKGETLLHVACADTKSFVGNSDTLVKQLLQAGADCNLATTSDLVDSEKVTPLMLATTAEVASCLLDNGADIERESNKGCTALYMACAHGRLAVAKVLLKRGAYHHILKGNEIGASPLSAAFVCDKVDITMLLLEYLFALDDFDINHPTLVLEQPLLCTAAWSGMCRVVEAALDHGAFINATGPDGTALRLAASEGHLDIVSLLCDRGADVSLRCGSMFANSIGSTLWRACAHHQNADQAWC
jgi:ankyrin repeat protein